MPDPSTPHPSARELADFRKGSLPPETFASVATHLAHCEECQSQAAKPRAAAVKGGTVLPAPPARHTPLPSPAQLPHEQPTIPYKKPALADLPAELASSSKYEVLGKLGEGGMGSVWKAKHSFLDCLVAIKVMSPAAVGHPEARARFLQEMKAAGKLKHDNIVRAFDAEQVGDLLLLVMEYVEGVSLEKLVKKQGRLSVGHACRFTAQAAEGLQHAHEQKLAHRDIKPANLMVTREKQVKVLDFGLARLPREQVSLRNQTQFQTFMGTPEYVAPEQAQDARSADIRADIYSLGCTLYYLLTGRPPFQGDTVINTILAHLQDDPPPLSQTRPDVPAELSAVVERMLAKQPEHRYQTPREVVQALQPFLGLTGKASEVEVPALDPAVGTTHVPQATARHTPVPARKTPPPMPAPPTVRHRRSVPMWLVLTSAGLAALVVSLVLVVLVMMGRDKDDPQTITVSPEPKPVIQPEGPPPVEVKPPPQPLPVVDQPEARPPRPFARLEGFTPLFVGDDLKRWKAPTDQDKGWKIDANGNLVGTDASGPLLTLDGQYKNFHYVIYARIKDAGSVGQLFRVDDRNKAHAAAHLGGRPGEPRQSRLTVGDEEVKSREAPSSTGWFRQDVIALGEHVVVKVDGVVTVDTRLQGNKTRLDAGHLGLQAVGQNAKLIVHYAAVKPLEEVEFFPAMVPTKWQQNWRTEGMELVQEPRAAGAQVFFGSALLGDFDFAVDAMRTTGSDGFGLCFRCGESAKTVALFGGWSNTWAVVDTERNGEVVATMRKAQRLRAHPGFRLGLANNTWYRAEVKVRKDKGECYLNGQQLFEFKATDLERGMVGLRVLGSGYRFKNITIKSPKGKPLVQGVPHLQVDPRADGLNGVADSRPPDETQVPAVKEMNRLAPFGQPVTGLGFYAANRLIVSERSGSGDNMSQWDLLKSRRLHSFSIHPGGTGHFAVSSDGKVGVSHGTGSGGKEEWALWTTADRKVVNRTDAPTSPQFLRFLPGSNRTRSINRLSEALQILTPLNVAAPAPMPQGKRRPPPAPVQLPPLRLGQTIRPDGAPNHSTPVVVAYSKDEASVVVGDEQGRVRVWDPATGKPRANGFKVGLAVRAVAFLHDGKHLVVGDAEGTVRVYEFAQGKEVARHSQHAQAVTCLAVAPDGKSFVSGGVDGLVYLWDAATWTPTGRCAGHSAPVTCVGVSWDSRVAVSGGDDRTVRLWGIAK